MNLLHLSEPVVRTYSQVLIGGQMNHPCRQFDARVYAANAAWHPSVVQVPGVVVPHTRLLQTRRAGVKRENTILSIISLIRVRSQLGLTVSNQQFIPTVGTPSTATHASELLQFILVQETARSGLPWEIISHIYRWPLIGDTGFQITLLLAERRKFWETRRQRLTFRSKKTGLLYKNPTKHAVRPYLRRAWAFPISRGYLLKHQLPAIHHAVSSTLCSTTPLV